MRITRAAKVAAFPLTALILVALVACQGPIGPKGPIGPPGSDGPIGLTGGTGPEGISVLQLRADGTDVRSINDDVANRIGPLPAPRAIADYFRGGVGLVEYSLGTPATFTLTTANPPVREAAAASTFVPMVSKNGMLTITQRVAGYLGTGADATEYTTGVSFAIKATDADKKSVEKIVQLLRNRPPTASEDTNAAFDTLNVGTQAAADSARDDKDADGATMEDPDNAVCAMFNACKVKPSSELGRAIANMNFADDMADLKFSATSKSSAVSLTDDMKTVTVTGVTSTWNAKKVGSAGHDSIIVRVRATDGGDLWIERDMEVTVDGAPTVKEQIPSLTFKAGATEQVLVRAVVGYFQDAESTLQIVPLGAEGLRSSNKNAATVTVDGDDIDIMPLNPGTTTITIRVAEVTTGLDPNDGRVNGLGQWVEQTVRVTVTQ